MSDFRIYLITLLIVLIDLRLNDATFLVSRNPNNIKFLLFKDCNNPDNSSEIPYGNETAIPFMVDGFNPAKPVILLLHDVLSNPKTPSDVQVIKNAYLEDKTNANIIMVDYSKLTTATSAFNTLSPFSVFTLIAGRFNANVVGKRVAEFICLGIQTNLIRGPESVHIVGFGLGAHIAGATGREIIQKLSKPIRRITGLDPSRQFPVLRNSGLDESDAQFVDVTYTSTLVDVGIKRGHAQFYLNGGGPHQPNCPNLFPLTETYCSHTTAVYYFAKSIKNKEIQACKCRRCRRSRYQPKSCSGTDLSVYGQCVPDGLRGNFFVGLS